MPFTFSPTGSNKADSFLSRAAHHLSALSATARTGWFASNIPAFRAEPCSSDMDGFSKELVLVILDRWRREIAGELFDECEDGASADAWTTEEPEDDDEDYRYSDYGSYEHQNRTHPGSI